VVNQTDRQAGLCEVVTIYVDKVRIINVYLQGRFIYCIVVSKTVTIL